MKINDKVIAAFLVSVGAFSAAQAIQYVSKLNNTEKNVIVSAAKNSNILIANSAILGTEGDDKKTIG